MDNSDPLVWYGIAAMIVSGLFIIIPYFRGKSDLLTAWCILLAGMAMYTGAGCAEVRYGDWPWPKLQWFQPTRHEVQWYMLTSATFIAALILCYYYNPFAKAIASRRLRKWPPLNGSVYFFVLAFCGAAAVLSFVMPRTTFIGLVTAQLSHKAVVFACVFSFMLWYQNRINVVWLMLFVGVFLAAAMFSMVVFSGRRLLLSVLLGPVLCVYWRQARYWKPRNCLAILTLATMLILSVSVVYSSFRWFSRGPTHQERTARSVLEQIRALATREDLFEGLLANKLHYFSQWSVHYSLLTKRYVDIGRVEPKPLNTLAFLASYPIPRYTWAGKPETIGITLVRDVVGDRSTNWGVGIPGHIAYEGGILALLLYALLIAFGIRLLDDPLRAQPTNPFLISMHAAALPHVIAIPRGDIGIMTIETVECFIFAALLGIACRLLFGTERSDSPGRIFASPVAYGYMRPGQPSGPQGLRH